MGNLESNSCNHLAKEIWTYCTDQKIWLSAVHIPVKDKIILLTICPDYLIEIENAG